MSFVCIIDSNVWSHDVFIPANKDVPYRYLICTFDPITENIHVRRWETHLNPRQISADHDEVTQIDSKLSPVVEAVPQQPSSPSTSKKSVPEIDTFGDINGAEKIDRGWLTTETVFQIKFIRNPFILTQKLKNRLLYVKVSITFLTSAFCYVDPVLSTLSLIAIFRIFFFISFFIA